MVFFRSTPLLTFINLFYALSKIIELDFSIERNELTSKSLISRHIQFSNPLSINNTIRQLQQEELSLTRLPDNLYKITLFLGVPSQKFEVAIDTGSFVSWVPSSKCKGCRKSFDSNKSITYKDLNKFYNIHYITGNNYGFLAQDKISLNTYNFSDFSFMLCDSGDWIDGADGLFGLGREYKNFQGDQFNMIATLHKANIIAKRMFSQKIIDNYRGKLYLGDYAQEISSNMSAYTSCAVNKHDTSVKIWWNCYLSHILLGENYTFDNTYSINNLAVFDTGASAILAPSYLLDYFTEQYLGPLYTTSACMKTFVSYLNAYTFNCFKSRMDFASLQAVNFLFNGWAYKLPAKVMWEETSNMYVFKIYFTGRDWLIGQPFLSNFHVVFDGENDRVGFFGGYKYDFTGFTRDPELEWYTLLMYSLGIAVGIIVIIVVVIYYLKKRREKGVNRVTYQDNVYYSSSRTLE
jgi:hypothetical protein